MTQIELAAPPTAAELAYDIHRHLQMSIGKTPETASLQDWRMALSLAIRDRIIMPWFQTTARVYGQNRKRVYYLSMEYLIGRLLGDTINNLGLTDIARAASRSLGLDHAALLSDEPDAALGNGGLGRLAACFLESMSTIGVPAHGYGIRYAHGLFRQEFEAGRQTERAEDWLAQRNPWEFERLEAVFEIGFGGGVKDGVWTPEDSVRAVAYDTPIAGWGGDWVNTLRLWSAKPIKAFDLAAFNRGDFLGAAAPEALAQTISRVLYPDDTTPQGKELRLKQEYFFTAASIRDILRRYMAHNSDPKKLGDKVAIQLNDTHPAIAGPELTRLLMDDHGLSFDDAFDTVRTTLHYTNHTLLPEALERWPEALMARVLPRHMELIARIDERHLADLKAANKTRPESVRIRDNGQVRMGDLAFISARKVNGVSALHTELMKETVFSGLHALHPERIVNVTNGVTPRRWLHACNPDLRALITDTIGEGWPDHLERLSELAEYADDPVFRARFAAAKLANKARLGQWLRKEHGMEVDPAAMFDIQIKRIHEYKRQLLNILETAALWNAIRRDPEKDWPNRVKIFGGKAAPGYVMAKRIIHLINAVADIVNNDPAMRGRLRVVYPPNYNLSMAERLIPAADLSEQISTAGMEASGTGNMKLALNGAITIGTLDGANIEIKDRVGDDNIFIFGMTAEEVAELREKGYNPAAFIADEPILGEVVDQIESGLFSGGDRSVFAPLVKNLREHDWFMVCAGFSDYWNAQRKIDAAWRNHDDWTRRAVLNTANTGWFSSDRSIRTYAQDIWEIDIE